MLLYFLLFLLSVFHSSYQCPTGWIPSAAISNKCYLVPNVKQNWFNAELYCRNAAAGAHLTSICSAFENADIDANVIDALTAPLAGQIWIGFNDIDTPGTYKWSDGISCPYKNWQTGQPHNSLQTQCVASLASSVGKWRTENCATENYFVCEVYMGAGTSTSGAFTPTTSTSTGYSQTTSTSTTFSPTTSTRTTPRTSTTALTTPSAPPGKATDCYDLYNLYHIRESGIYTIYPPGLSRLQVYCDMTTDGGGWTVFQKRIDASVSFFNKTWIEYKQGFNNGLNNNLWLGNDNINILSAKDANVELRIDLWGDRAPGSSLPNSYWYEKRSSFKIDTEANYYTLHISPSYIGNASSPGSSGFIKNNGMLFSTIDRKHYDDSSCGGCCAARQFGGWWLYGCSYVSLNGKYVPSQWHFAAGFDWYPGYYINPAESRMMLRRGSVDE